MIWHVVWQDRANNNGSVNFMYEVETPVTVALMETWRQMIQKEIPNLSGPILITFFAKLEK